MLDIKPKIKAAAFLAATLYVMFYFSGGEIMRSLLSRRKACNEIFRDA